MLRKMLVVVILLSSLVLTSCSDMETDYFISNNYPSEFKTYYEDLRFPASQIKITGSSNLPKYNTFLNDTMVLYFNAATMEQAFITMQFPHARIPNSTIYPHFHWTYNEPKAFGDVVWCMEYTCANIGDIFPTTNESCVVDTARDPYEHHMTDMITINNTFEESAMCVIRLYRDATSPDDTFPTDAGLLEFDVYYLNHFYGELMS